MVHGWDFVLPLQETWVQSLVRELKSLTLWGITKTKNKKLSMKKILKVKQTPKSQNIVDTHYVFIKWMNKRKMVLIKNIDNWPQNTHDLNPVCFGFFSCIITQDRLWGEYRYTDACTNVTKVLTSSGTWTPASPLPSWSVTLLKFLLRCSAS